MLIPLILFELWAKLKILHDDYNDDHNDDKDDLVIKIAQLFLRIRQAKKNIAILTLN